MNRMVTICSGTLLAAGVAEDMVVYLRRSLRDPEMSPFLINRRHPHAAVHHAGVSPLKFLRVIRLERARQLIERGASVSNASEIAGFRSDLHLRRAWSGQWGGSPRDAQKTASMRQRASLS